MKDGDREIERRIAARHRALSPLERFAAAASLFESAGRLVAASLPEGMPEDGRRRSWIRRMHGSDLPDAAAEAYARIPLATAADRAKDATTG